MNKNEVLGISAAWFAAGILIIAAVLKLNQQTNFGWYVDSTPSAFWMNLVGIFTDIVLAALLLSGMFRKNIFVICGAIFVMYGYMNLYFHFTDQSCGCFGKLTPDPLVMMGIDGIVAILLFAIGWSCKPFQQPTRTQFSATAVMFLIAVCASATYIYQYDPGNILADGTGFGRHSSDSGEIQLLDPTKWVGQPFTLLDSTEESIEKESAIYVLVSKNCGKCQNLLEQIIFKKRTESASNQDIVIVNIDGPTQDIGFGIVTTHLDLSKRWYCKTPTAIEVKDGTVRRILNVSEAL